MNLHPCAATVLLTLVLTACGGGGGASSGGTTSGFTIKLGMTAGTAPATRLLGGRSATVAIDPAELEFDVAMAGNQGVLYASANGTQEASRFNVTTQIEGTTVGSGFGSEAFPISEPSLVNYHGTGRALVNQVGETRPYGVFMARFKPTGATEITVTPASPAVIETVDEIVLRIGAPYYMMYDADHPGTQVGALIAAPHFVYNPGSGPRLYSDVTEYCFNESQYFRVQNLAVNTKAAFANLEYLFFIPRSLPGLSAAFTSGLIFGPDSFTVPVQNPADPNSPLKPNAAYADGNWCFETGNAGLNAVIDEMVGLPRTSPEWLAMSSYFQQFILKFNKTGCIPWNAAGVIGNVGGLSAEVVILEAPLTLSKGSTLSLTYKADQSAYAYDADADLLTLSGTPPLNFVTSVQ